MVVRRLHGESGFTLVELLVVVVIIGIATAITSIGFDMVYNQQLNSAKARLLSDLKKARADALTNSSPCTDALNNPPYAHLAHPGIPHPFSHTRGYGVRFTSESSYVVFEFFDIDEDFAYDGAGEDYHAYSVKLDGNVYVRIKPDAQPTHNDYIRIYDNRGIPRKRDWSPVGSLTYIIRHPKVDAAKCIVVDTTLTREGVWNVVANDCK